MPACKSRHHTTLNRSGLMDDAPKAVVCTYCNRANRLNIGAGVLAHDKRPTPAGRAVGQGTERATWKNARRNSPSRGRSTSSPGAASPPFARLEEGVSL